jgi:MFS family permease
VNRFGGFVQFFLVLYVRSGGWSPAAAGGAVSAYGLGGLGSAVWGGVLADRFGRRNSIALSMVASAVATLALWRASSLAAILVLAAVAGLAGELYRPASTALLADVLEPDQRVLGFAVYRLAINAGTAAGPAIGGVVAERGFGPLFVADAATSLVFAAVALAALPHGVRVARHEERRGEATRTIVRDRTFLLFCAGTLAGALVYLQMTATLPLAVVDDGHGRAFYGFLIALNGALVLAIELPLVGLLRRLPPRGPMVVGQLLLGLGFALTGASPAALALAVSVIVWTMGEILFSPVSQAYLAELAPVTLRGRYAAAWGMTFAVASVAGPAAGTALYGWRPDALWLSCLGCGVVAALFVAAARR